MALRVMWTGRPYGHARWPSKIVTPETEEEARALVAAPMPALMVRVVAQRHVPGRDAWGGDAGRWETFASRKRTR